LTQNASHGRDEAASMPEKWINSLSKELYHVDETRIHRNALWLWSHDVRVQPL